MILGGSFDRVGRLVCVVLGACVLVGTAEGAEGVDGDGAPATLAQPGLGAYPTHWGEPPRIQTQDIRPLPGGYGMGSSTLAVWIQRHLDRDAAAGRVPVAGPAGGLLRKAPVDASTMEGKVLVGYQGWFACEGDGSPYNRWVHWFRRTPANPHQPTFDAWPDLTQFGPTELFATPLKKTDGTAASLFSSWPAATVDRHFRWMEEYGLDGVMLQRFLVDVGSSAGRAFRDGVTRNVRTAAEAHGRVFCLTWDFSGQSVGDLFERWTNDLERLRTELKVFASPQYQRHLGKPLIGLWGFGFAGREDTPELAMKVIEHAREAGFTTMGGLPSYWRTLRRDTQTNAAWAPVFLSFDILQPWAVGRFRDDAGADTYDREVTRPDLAAVTQAGRAYMPVLWPGFTWHNLKADQFNAIPRRGGRFFWRQAANASAAGARMAYIAMFDEVDEGTAIFKVAAKRSEAPTEGTWYTLDADGETLPSDWYLRVAGEFTRRFRAGTPVGTELPLSPETSR